MSCSWEGVPLLMMADYFADPIWVRGSDGRARGMVRLDDLPLSPGLVRRLRNWAGRFDALMHTDYQWPSDDDYRQWVVTGHALCAEVKAELGSVYDVEYFHTG